VTSYDRHKLWKVRFDEAWAHLPSGKKFMRTFKQIVLQDNFSVPLLSVLMKTTSRLPISTAPANQFRTRVNFRRGISLVLDLKNHSVGFSLW